MFAYSIYIAVLLFAPLAFGTTELWSMVTVEVLSGAAAMVLFTSLWIRRERLVAVPGLVPLLLLLGFMALQLVPLPPIIVKMIAPASYDAYAPLFAIGGEQWIPLTVHQKNTMQELFRIGSYGLFYVITVQLLSTHLFLKRTLGVVISLTAMIAFLAIIERVSSADTLFWLRARPNGTSPFGPWVNPNQYAGFMEMMSPLAIALFLFYKPRASGSASLRERVVTFFTMPGGSRHLVYGCAAVVITLSVFVSLCRGGILTISVAVLIFMLLYNLKKPQQGRGAVLMIILCIVVTVSWFGWDTVIAEFNSSVNAEGQLSDGRFDQWKDILPLIRDFMFFGSGFGTYIDIYPSYKTIPLDAIFDHAHNDYLELLAEGGLIGFGLAAWFVLAVIRHGWSLIRARRDQYAALLGIGGLTGVLTMLLHSFTDFNMHNGADGLYFFFICGLLVTTVNSRFSGYESKSLLKEQSGRKTPVYAMATLLFVAGLSFVQFRTVLAGVAFGQVKDIYVSRNLLKDKRQELRAGVAHAESLDPFERRYSGKLAALAWAEGNMELAKEKYLATVRKNPMTGDALQWLGLATEDEALAKTLVENGYRRAINRDELALTYAGFLLHNDERAKAIAVMAEETSRKNSMVRRWTPLMESFAFTPEETRAALPRTPDAWIIYGDYLQKVGDLDGAEYYRANALSFIDQAEAIRPAWYQQLIQFYRETGNEERAQLVLREAVEKLPNNASFHVQLGDYFRAEGITFKAEEEYKRALMIEPAHAGAKRGLRKMGLLDAY